MKWHDLFGIDPDYPHFEPEFTCPACGAVTRAQMAQASPTATSPNEPASRPADAKGQEPA